MKKLFKVLCALLLVGSLVACSKDGEKGDESDNQEKGVKLTVSATLDPHSKILEFAKPILKADYNIDLEIIVLDDYYIFNKALDAGEVDANYFQHLPFFNGEVADNGYKITNVAGIHIEPFGFYSKTVKDIKEIAPESKIVISNSPSDHGRILSILESYGLISLKTGTTAMDAVIEDITSNPLNLKFVEIKPELLTIAFDNNEGDLVAINGNYALAAGLNPTKDAVILEKADETNPYVNIVAVKTGSENDDKIQKLVTVLKSDAVKKFITETYTDGSVIPAE